MAHRLAEYRPRWIEEPVKPDDIPAYARIGPTNAPGLGLGLEIDESTITDRRELSWR